MPTKIFKDFCPRSLLEGRAEILKIFGWHFGRNDEFMNSLWMYWPLQGGSFHENLTKLKIPFGTYPPLLFCDFFCRRSVTLAVNPWDLPRNFSTRLLFYNQFYCCLDTLIFFKFSQGLQFSFVEHISRFFLLRQIWIVNYCVKNPVKNYQ